MKKHILSTYSEKKSEGAIQLQVSEKTFETRNIETSDPDEFVLQAATIRTSQIEISDPGKFILQAPTIGTFQKEDSDPDEFLVSVLEKCNGGDFDSILLI